MKKWTKRLFTLMLSLCMLISFIPAVTFTVSAATQMVIMYDTAYFDVYTDEACTVKKFQVETSDSGSFTFYLKMKDGYKALNNEIEVMTIGDRGQAIENVFAGSFTGYLCTFREKNGIYSIDGQYQSGLISIALTGNNVFLKNRSIQYGTSIINSQEHLYVGEYNTIPHKWRVLDSRKTSTMYDDGMFLLSENILYNTEYNMSYAGDIYSADYHTASFINRLKELSVDMFSIYERKTLIPTTESEPDYLWGGTLYIDDNSDLNEDLLFLLSAMEAADVDYFPNGNDDRIATLDGEAHHYWLRTPSDVEIKVDGAWHHYAGIVQNDGNLYRDKTTSKLGVRPAFNFDPTTVLFTSAAVDTDETNTFVGKTTFSQVKNYKGTEWKVTLKDDRSMATGTSHTYVGLNEEGQSETMKNTAVKLTEGYDATPVSLTHKSMGNVSSNYNKITATMKNASNDILYYGSINGNYSATTSTFTVPAGLGAGEYTVEIRGEEWNGPRRNDSASGTAYEFKVNVAPAAGYSERPAEPVVQASSKALSPYSSVYGHDILFYGKDDTERWLVLDTKTNTGEDGVFVLAEEIQGTGVAFNAERSNAWQGSDAQTWAKTYLKNDTFFGYKERDVMFAISKDDAATTFATPNASGTGATNWDVPAGTGILKDEKLFFLSVDEVRNPVYGLGTAASRVAMNGSTAMAYWLRSPVEGSITFVALAALVDPTGKLVAGNTATTSVDGEDMGARPAFNLNPEMILFTTAADNSGHQDFAPVPEASVGEWKIAAADEFSYKEGVSLDKVSVVAGGSITVTHPSTNSINSHYNRLTAALIDESGVVVAYGAINSDINATMSTVTVPAGVEPGIYTLQIQGEIWKPAEITDYATGKPFSTTIAVQESVAVNLKGENVKWYADPAGEPITRYNGVANAEIALYFKPDEDFAYVGMPHINAASVSAEENGFYKAIFVATKDTTLTAPTPTSTLLTVTLAGENVTWYADPAGEAITTYQGKANTAVTLYFKANTDCVYETDPQIEGATVTKADNGFYKVDFTPTESITLTAPAPKSTVAVYTLDTLDGLIEWYDNEDLTGEPITTYRVPIGQRTKLYLKLNTEYAYYEYPSGVTIDLDQFSTFDFDTGKYAIHFTATDSADIVMPAPMKRTGYAYKVRVGEVELENGWYTKTGDEVYIGTPTENVESYAYYKDGVLTLKDFETSSPFGYAISADEPITVNAVGQNRITCDGYGVVWVYGNVTFMGTGRLELICTNAEDGDCVIVADGVTLDSGVTLVMNSLPDGVVFGDDAVANLTLPDTYYWRDDADREWVASADQALVVGEQSYLEIAGTASEPELLTPTLSFVIDNWRAGEEPSQPEISYSGDAEEYAIYYAKEGTEYYTDVVPTEAGYYTAKIVFPATNKYKEISATCNFSIIPGGMLLPLFGDVDQSGEVNAADALLALQAATNKVTLSEIQMLLADVDASETITANDALMILQYATKKIDSFPIESLFTPIEI